MTKSKQEKKEKKEDNVQTSKSNVRTDKVDTEQVLKPEKQVKLQDNWWRKYTKEYQEEDLGKAEDPGRGGAGAPKVERPKTPKKTLVSFNDQDMLPNFSGLSEEVERVMQGLLKSSIFTDDFFKKPAMPRLMRMEGHTFRKPISEVKQTKDEVIVSIELPGVKKDNIKIRIEGMNLIIDAQSKTGNENRKKGFFSFSKSYTGFRHIIRLPAPVEKEASSAHYEAGILRVVLKKKEPSRESGNVPIE